MENVRYMISDAANIVNVESHVLRYWEEELELMIPRNEMGHRYYTEENIAQFQKIKEWKEQGYQLKAIRMMIHSTQNQPEPGAHGCPAQEAGVYAGSQPEGGSYVHPAAEAGGYGGDQPEGGYARPAAEAGGYSKGQPEGGYARPAAEPGNYAGSQPEGYARPAQETGSHSRPAQEAGSHSRPAQETGSYVKSQPEGGYVHPAAEHENYVNSQPEHGQRQYAGRPKAEAGGYPNGQAQYAVHPAMEAGGFVNNQPGGNNVIQMNREYMEMALKGAEGRQIAERQSHVSNTVKLEQFQSMMLTIVKQAVEENNQALGKEVGTQVGDKVLKEMNYLMREQDEAEEERFRKLDEAIRTTRKAKRFRKEKKAKKEKDPAKLVGKEKNLNPNLTV